MEEKIDNVGLELEKSSEKEKLNSEELHWKLVDANLKDVQEDVWEKLVVLVQD